MEEPFLAFRKCDIQIEWKPLWDGEIVTTTEFYQPNVNFVFHVDSASSQTRVDETLANTLRDQIPFKINSLIIHNGEIHYVDYRQPQRIDLYMHDVYAKALNLTNQVDTAGILPASCSVRATSIGGGFLDATMRFDMLQDPMPVDLNMKMTRIDLTALNAFFKQYAYFTVEEGSLAVVAEIALANNRINGYIKPFIEELDVTNREERLPLIRKVYESALDVVGFILENRQQETVASRVVIEGVVVDPDVGIFTAIFEALRHAFFMQLLPQYDLTVDISNVLSGRPGQPYSRERIDEINRNSRRENRQQRREERQEERQAQRENR